jgi:hypothetical protein
VGDGKLFVFETKGGRVGVGSWEPAPPPFKWKVEVEILLGAAEAPRQNPVLVDPVLADIVLFAAAELPALEDAVGCTPPPVFGLPVGGFVCVALYLDCAERILDGTGAIVRLKDEHSATSTA